jgi:flagellar protein FliS
MTYNLPLANRYRETAIKTANPLQLVVILYDGAIQALQEAREHIQRRDIGKRARCLNRSVAIISELQACLNFDANGNIAQSLDRLYDFMKQGIMKASLEQRIEPLDQVIGLLENLRSAWGELATQSINAGSSVVNSAESAPRMLKNLPAARDQRGLLNISG